MGFLVGLLPAVFVVVGEQRLQVVHLGLEARQLFA
jgi:hypothetical protein